MERPEQPSTRSGECPSPPSRQGQTPQASKDFRRDSYGTFSDIVKVQPTFGSPEDMKYELGGSPRGETSEGAYTRLTAPCTSPSEEPQGDSDGFDNVTCAGFDALC